MRKIKLIVNVIVEYEPNAKFYPEGSSLEQMLEIDLRGAKDDPFMTIDSTNAEWTITGEIVE